MLCLKSRSDKSQCDKKRPQCSQCLKRSIPCVGYREALDLVLRIENEKLAKRVGSKPVLKAVSIRRKPGGASGSLRSVEDAVDAEKHHDLNPAWSLSQSPSQVAICVFAFNFSQGAYLDYLPALFASTHRSEILETSLEAVSMLCYARQTQSESLMQNASLTYSLALNKTQKALDATSHAAQDHILAAVMLLALYAALSANSTHASTSWTKHINGALALAALRPRDSFRSLRAQKLLCHVISCIQLDCIQRRERLPSQLRTLYGVAMPGGDFYLRFCNLIESLAELRATATEDVSGRMARVIELDREAAFLLDLMPFAENFKQLQDIDGEVYHVYSGYRSAQSWNTLRLARLTLMELLSSNDSRRSLRYADKLFIEDSNETSRVVSSMIGDICYSVPRFLRPQSQCAELQPYSSAWIGSLIWPLGQALASPFITYEWYQRVLDQLLLFSRISKDPQIGTAARLMCQGEAANDWYENLVGWFMSLTRDRLHILYLF
jgi:hypothetical protein